MTSRIISWEAGYRWHADLDHVNRWNVKSVSGAGLVQLGPIEGIRSITIQGVHSYERRNHGFSDFLDKERETAIEFLAELMIQWP